MLKSRAPKRTLALILCIIMVCSVSAFAAGNGTSELLPLSVVEFFAEQGYNISRTAKMELVPVEMTVAQEQQLLKSSNYSTQKSGYALRVTEQIGNEGIIYEVVILEPDEDKPGYTINSDVATAVSNGNPVGSQTMPVGNIVVTASGSYQTYLKQGLGNLYQIQTLLWSYSKNASCTVNSVTVSYGAAGTAYSVPSLDLTHYSYSHVITSDIASPSEGYTYFKDSTPCPFAVDIAVSSSSGSMGGMYFSCYAYIDGVRHTWH